MCRRGTIIWLAIAFLLGNRATAAQYAFQVTFSDKNNTPYSLSSPLAYLSARSILRRTTQGIAIDSTDLPVNATYVDSVLQLTGGILHEQSRWMNMCVILVSDSSLIHTLDSKSFVSGIKFVAYYGSYLHHKTGYTTTATGTSPSVKPLQKTTSSDNTYYSNTWQQTALVNGNSLYDKGYEGTGKLIAVLDAGFIGADVHPGFDSLRNSGRILDTHNFTLDTSYVYGSDLHGAQVLSTMAGYAPGIFVGTAPLAYYALYITEDDNSEQPIELINMLCGAERADSLGADIITTSLGYNEFDYEPWNFNFSTDLDGKTTTAAKAANMATRKGMLFVASAGNEGGDTWNMILTPGDADSALTIGSVSITGVNAPSSGFGPNAAGQVKPDVCGVGSPANIFNFVDNSYSATDDGTSFATPQIAGWAACLWQGTPDATPYQIKQAIIRCANHYTDPGTQIGYGIPNFECTEQILGVKSLPGTFATGTWLVATPNPFNDQMELSVDPATNGLVRMALLDMTGRTVFSTSIYFYKGTNTPATIAMPGLPAGNYILKATSASGQEMIKLVKE